MLDGELVAERRRILCSRFTSEELIELLDVPVGEVFDRFLDECLELNIEDL